jgi:hypothetical protein
MCGDYRGHVVEESFSDESECCVVILCQINFRQPHFSFHRHFAFRVKSEGKRE